MRKVRSKKYPYRITVDRICVNRKKVVDLEVEVRANFMNVNMRYLLTRRYQQLHCRKCGHLLDNRIIQVEYYTSKQKRVDVMTVWYCTHCHDEPPPCGKVMFLHTQKAFDLFEVYKKERQEIGE